MARRHHIKQRNVYFDFETGGSSHWKHPIIQIGAVAIDSDWNELERFEVKLKFKEAAADPEALKKVHYSNHLWDKHGVEPVTAFERFGYFLREHATNELISRRTGKVYHAAQLVSHNHTFEKQFLEQWLSQLRKEHKGHELFLPYDPRIICTQQAAMLAYNFADEKPANYQLGTLCDYLGIDFSTNRAHEAVYDSVKSAELHHALLSKTEQPIQWLVAA